MMQFLWYYMFSWFFSEYSVVSQILLIQWLLVELQYFLFFFEPGKRLQQLTDYSGHYQFKSRMYYCGICSTDRCSFRGGHK